MKKIIGKTLAVLGIGFLTVAIVVLNGAIISATETDIYYTCPMPEHSDVVMDKPGKCPKCGMELVAKKKEPVIKYTCPMPEHSDVVMDKPGKCPKCGMSLVPMKSDKK